MNPDVVMRLNFSKHRIITKGKIERLTLQITAAEKSSFLLKWLSTISMFVQYTPWLHISCYWIAEAVSICNLH